MTIQASINIVFPLSKTAGDSACPDSPALEPGGPGMENVSE